MPIGLMIKNTGHKTAERKVLYNGRNTENRDPLCGKNSSIYPARLRELSGMPKQLYYIGRFPEDNKPTAAIVGARLCSAYGRIQAFRYGKFLSEHGVQVISGMAAGIDAEGHKGALKEERLHLRYLEMVWISAILHPAVGFIGGFRRRTEDHQ